MSERSARTTASAPVDMRYPGPAGRVLPDAYENSGHLPFLQAIARFKNPRPCGVASSLESPWFVAERALQNQLILKWMSEARPKRCTEERSMTLCPHASQ